MLSCNSNQLTSIPDLSSLTSLRMLSCNSNQLTGIPDLSSLTSLERLYCNKNKLSDLPKLPQGLQKLDCYGNQLTSFLEFPPTLTHLYYYKPQPIYISETNPDTGKEQLARYTKEKNQAIQHQELKELMTRILERLDKIEEEIKLIPGSGKLYLQAEQNYNDRTK